METFYYTAVSSAAGRKVTGKIAAETEKNARKELNKIGLSILSISPEKPADWGSDESQKFFEFEAEDSLGKVINGTVEAVNEEESYDRLVSEFNFKVRYVCPEGASESEKEEAKKNSVKNILKLKTEKEAKEKEEKVRTLKGGLETLVKIAEGGHKEEKEKTFDLKEDQENFESKDQPNQEEYKTEESEEEGENLESGDEPKKNDLKTSIENFKQSFEKIYYHLTEVIVPTKGKTRMEALKEIQAILFPKKQASEIDTKKQLDLVMRRKAIVQRLWLALENIIGALAFVFSVYIIVGGLALRFEFGYLSTLAEKTLANKMLIPFFAFTFIVLWILIWLREHFTSWSPVRTFLLFLVGGFCIFVVGANFL